MACIQPRRNGLCLVRCSSMDRRRVRVLDDSSHLEQLARCQFITISNLKNSLTFVGGRTESRRRRHSQRHSQLRHQHRGLCVLLFLLARISSFHLATGSQNSAFIHSQGIFRADCRYCLLHLGCRESQGNWSHRSSTWYGKRIDPRLGHGSRYHELDRQFCDADCE